MSELLHLDLLKKGRVLLAFSGGVDSTALFHLLRKHTIAFDIAHVNYHTRDGSDREEQSARDLAQKHNLQCHIHSCRLDKTNFEHRAREERYRFFTLLMKQHPYTYLLTAHQLNDRFEWMLMQLTRGAGLPEILGIRSYDERPDFTLLRPLLEYSRDEIEHYLATHQIPHFLDESNENEHYRRNRFRHLYSTPLLREYADAIGRSFRYLEEDREELIHPLEFKTMQELNWSNTSTTLRSTLYGIDQYLKSLGFLLNSHEKESLKKKKKLIVERKLCVVIEEEYLFIAPYRHTILMDKSFKEECRKRRIEPKLRGYLYESPEAMGIMRQLKEFPKPLQSD